MPRLGDCMPEPPLVSVLARLPELSPSDVPVLPGDAMLSVGPVASAPLVVAWLGTLCALTTTVVLGCDADATGRSRVSVTFRPPTAAANEARSILRLQRKRKGRIDKARASGDS